MAGKQYLMTPGPTPVPPQVLAAMAEAVVHHRRADLRVVHQRCLGPLPDVRRTRVHGAEVEELRYEWGETPVAADLAARLDELGGAKVVFLTQSETSTGVVSD